MNAVRHDWMIFRPSRPEYLPSRAHFDLIESDRRSNPFFDAHLFRKPFHTFRDAL
ncbi:Hypothetical protein BSSP1_II1190 [Brucella suis bv. 2]|nr:Hypothetical protein BSSP1_II1190 [Brucella suis bv. 2]